MTESIETPAAPAASAGNPENLPAFSQADLDRILKERLARAVPADYADVKAKAEEFDKYQQAQKTEAQRQADAIATAQREAAEAKSQALAYKVAASHGVTPDYFDLLGTGDEETINARAERIGGFLKSQAENARLQSEIEAIRSGKPAPASSRPIADLKPGATPDAPLTEDDAIYNSMFPAGS